MAALAARAFRIAVSIVVPVALGMRLRVDDAPEIEHPEGTPKVIQSESRQSESRQSESRPPQILHVTQSESRPEQILHVTEHPEWTLQVTQNESRPVQTLQGTQSESRPAGAPPSKVDLGKYNGEWEFVKGSNFKKFYKSVSTEYNDWRIVVFKDSSPERPSENMKNEIDALEKIRGWDKLGPDGVVKVVPVDAIVKDGTVHAMAIEWIDGDFFDIAKIHNHKYASMNVLLIAARGPDDKKVDISERGMMGWQRQLPDAEKLRQEVVQNKLQRMFASLNAIKQVEAAIVDLQVMVRKDGQMVIMDPLAVGELPEQSSNLLGTGLTAPSFGNGAGHIVNKLSADGAKWAVNRARQTMNINAALTTLQEALESDQGLPKRPQRTARTLALPTSNTLGVPTSNTLKLPFS